MVPIDQAMEVLKAYGFPVLPFGFAQDAKTAAAKAKEIGYPIVLKAISPQIVHKFDFGAVRLNLRTTEDILEACKEIQEKFAKVYPQGKLEGFFIQKMSAKGIEVILGMNRDPRLGPAIMFGLGGIYVEVMKDVTFRLAPVRQRSAELMVESIRGFKILKGVRGEKGSDIPKVVECIERLSQLVSEYDQIQEIDVNPLMVHEEGQGASVLDARIILKVKPAAK